MDEACDSLPILSEICFISQRFVAQHSKLSWCNGKQYLCILYIAFQTRGKENNTGQTMKQANRTEEIWNSFDSCSSNRSKLRAAIWTIAWFMHCGMVCDLKFSQACLKIISIFLYLGVTLKKNSWQHMVSFHIWPAKQSSPQRKRC